MLSCKDQGVKFYFSSDLDLKKLDSPSIDCFFDATAGKLVGDIYRSPEHPPLTLQYRKRHLRLNDAIVRQLHGLPNSEGDYAEFMLRYSGSFYYPFYENTKIHTHMFKLTGIPVKKLKIIREFLKPLNNLNRFYVWEGTLNSEINEALILVNLTNKEHKILTPSIEKPQKIDLFIQNNTNILSFLNEDITAFLKFLVEINVETKVCIERPFTYSPHVNLEPETGLFNGKPIFPIGDSLFVGNPKVGNGLGSHLSFLNDLIVEVIASR